MKRIHRAIYESFNKDLIDFDEADKLKKSAGATTLNIKKFHFGDYVYKDTKLGYNNYIGEKVAVCVSDKPGQELYAVLFHPLLNNAVRWCDMMDSNSYNDTFIEFDDGWEIKLNILNNYSNEINDTIWAYLQDDEYIPAKNELLTIYNNCNGTPIWDELCLQRHSYWTSSYYPYADTVGRVYCGNFITGDFYVERKTSRCQSVVLLHI